MIIEMSYCADAATTRPNPPYHPAGLNSALALLGSVAPEAAKLVAAVLAVRERGADALDAQLVADNAWPGLAPADAIEAIRDANREAVDRLGIDLIVYGRRVRDHASSLHSLSETVESEPFTQPSLGHEARGGSRSTLLLSETLVGILDEAPSVVEATDDPAEFDLETHKWLAVVTAMAENGRGGHLAARVTSWSKPRLASDCAAAFEGRAPVFRLHGSEALAAAILRIELHAGTVAPVVFVEDRSLVLQPDASPPEDWLDAPVADATGLSPAPFQHAARWLPHVRATYLWPIPEAGSLKIGELSFIGGVIGPVRYHPRWIERVLARQFPDDIGSAAAQVLARRLADPRDATTIARIATVAAQTLPLDLSGACAMVAASFTAAQPDTLVMPKSFEPRLLVCESEAHALLERAAALAQNGCRLLAWGPPGGGKSTYARVLASKMADGRTVRVVTPADILARHWGAMERLVRAVWRRAADDGEVLIIDEFEAICGRRDGETTSGNALLVRSLTDEFLRNFDEFPDVPLIATVNDVDVVDAAARRRFAFVLRFGDTMNSDQEGLAWQLILGRAPPPAWKPCGASVADVCLARSQCKMLGLTDAPSLMRAISKAREARLGVPYARARMRRSTVH